MQLNEERKKEVSTSKKRNSKKHTVAIADSVYLKLKTFVSDANEKSRGKNIGVADIIKYASSLIKTSDISKIQNQSLSIKDKIEIEYERYIKKTGDSLSFDEYLALKLKIQ